MVPECGAHSAPVVVVVVVVIVVIVVIVVVVARDESAFFFIPFMKEGTMCNFSRLLVAKSYTELCSYLIGVAVGPRHNILGFEN